LYVGHMAPSMPKSWLRPLLVIQVSKVEDAGENVNQIIT
jgi:hypothetical protein